MTRFRVRSRLASLLRFKRNKTEKPDILVEASSQLKAELVEVAGSEDEFIAISHWKSTHQDVPSVENYQHVLSTPSALSFIRIKTAFARVALDYDKANGNSPRSFKDQELASILETGRTIIAITQKDQEINDQAKLQFAYTIGNSIANEALPELLTFFPGQNTISTALNSISERLDQPPLKDLNEGDYVQFEGILGAFGEVPVRMRLLTESEKELSFSQWTTGVPRDSKIALIEIPDLEGRFCDQQGCDKEVLSIFPQSLKTKRKPKNIDVHSDISELSSVSAKAFYFCLGAQIDYLKTRPDGGEEWQPQTWGTLLTLINAQETTNPDIYAIESVEEAEEHIDYCKTIAKTLSAKTSAEEWVRECLEDYSDTERDEDIAYDWCLPPPVSLSEEFKSLEFHTHFSSKEELIKSIDWNIVAVAAKYAFQDSLNPERVEQCRILVEMTEEKTG